MEIKYILIGTAIAVAASALVAGTFVACEQQNRVFTKFYTVKNKVMKATVPYARQVDNDYRHSLVRDEDWRKRINRQFEKEIEAEARRKEAESAKLKEELAAKMQKKS